MRYPELTIPFQPFNDPLNRDNIGATRSICIIAQNCTPISRPGDDYRTMRIEKFGNSNEFPTAGSRLMGLLLEIRSRATLFRPDLLQRIKCGAGTLDAKLKILCRL